MKPHDRQPGSGPAISFVGRYEVLGKLGHGGMGVVYLGWDPGLGRKVALKRPAAEITFHRELRERFLREARAASAVDHPNVVTVYEVFEHEGVPWLAMALVDGHSLRDVLNRDGPLPLEQVLQHGVELAGALEAAHGQSVLHRDVNPNNILLTRDGRAMLADFGLARYHISSQDPSEAPTRERTLTAAGRVQGTPGYMSPEQSQGLPLDPRTDIYSLGLVLAEMCTGQRPDEGLTEEGISRPVREREADRTPSLNSTVPRELERVLRRAVSSRREERHPDANTLLADLRDLLRRYQYERYSQEHPVQARGRNWTWLSSVLVIIGVLAVMAGLYEWLSRGLLEPLSTQAARLVSWPTQESDGCLSPDGQWLSFLSDRDGDRAVWVQRLDGGEARRLSPPDGQVLSHAWSPDGRQIARLVQRGGDTFLEVLPAPLGGAPRFRQRLESVFVHRIVRWIGDEIYLESGRSLWRFSIDSADLVEIAPHDARFEFRRQFDVHPDGKGLVFSGVQDGREAIWLASPDGSRARRLTDDAHHVADPHWAGGETLLFLSDRGGPSGIWRTRIAGGEAWPVPFAKEAAQLDDVARDGSRAVIGVVEEKANLWWIGPGTARPRQISAGSSHEFAPTRADGREIVLFQRARPGARSGLALTDADLVQARWEGNRFVEEQVVVERGYAPLLAPDGRWFAFLRPSTQGPYFTELWLGELGGSLPRRLSERFQMTGMITFPLELLSRGLLWSPSSGDLFFVEVSEQGPARVMRLSPPETEPVLVVAAPEDYQEILDLALSGEGERLAYVRYALTGGTWEVHQFDLTTQEQSSLYRETLPTDGHLYLLGGRGRDAWVVGRTVGAAQGPAGLEILEVGSTGSTRLLVEVPGAVGATARLDARRETVYVTAVTGGAHNIVAVPLDGGEPRAITENQLPGTTFSGLEISHDGAVFFCQHDVNEDLWLLTMTDQARPGGGEGS